MPSSRFRPSPNEEAALSKKDFEERRKARLIQVRKQESEIAASVRGQFQRRLSTEHEQLAAQLQSEWNEYQEAQNRILRERRELAAAQIGEAHKNAAFPPAVPYSKTEEGIRDAKHRAEARHLVAVKQHAAEEERLLQLQSQHVDSRANVLAAEKHRAKRLASRPLKADTELADILATTQGAVRGGPSRSTKAPLGPTYHHLNAHASPVTATRPGTAMVEAEDVENQHCIVQQTREQTMQEQQEAARLRHHHALQHVRLRRDYDQQLQELETLKQADNRRRQRQLETVPKSLFVAPFIREEQRHAEESELERRVEAMCFNRPLNHSPAVSAAAAVPAPALVPTNVLPLPSGSMTDLSVSSLSSSGELSDTGGSPVRGKSSQTVPDGGAPRLPPTSSQSQPLHRLLEHVRSQQHRNVRNSATRPASLPEMPSDVRPTSAHLQVSETGEVFSRPSKPLVAGSSALNMAPRPMPTSTQTAAASSSSSSSAASGSACADPVSHSSSVVATQAQPTSSASSVLCQNCANAQVAAGVGSQAENAGSASVDSAVSIPLLNGVALPSIPGTDLSSLPMRSVAAASNGGPAFVVVTTPSILTVHQLSASSSASSSLASIGIPSVGHALSGSLPIAPQTTTVSASAQALFQTMSASSSISTPSTSTSQYRSGASGQALTATSSPPGSSDARISSTSQLLPGWENTQAQLAQYRQSQQDLLKQFQSNMLQLQQQQVSLSEMMLHSASLQSSPGSQLSLSHSSSSSQFLSPSPAVASRLQRSPGSDMSQSTLLSVPAASRYRSTSVISSSSSTPPLYSSPLLVSSGLSDARRQDVLRVPAGNRMPASSLNQSPATSSYALSTSDSINLADMPSHSGTTGISTQSGPLNNSGVPLTVAALSQYLGTPDFLGDILERRHEELSKDSSSDRLRSYVPEDPEPVQNSTAHADALPILSVIVEEPSILSSSTSSLASVTTIDSDRGQTLAEASQLTSQPSVPPPGKYSSNAALLKSDPSSGSSDTSSQPRSYEGQLEDLLARLRRVKSASSSSPSDSGQQRGLSLSAAQALPSRKTAKQSASATATTASTTVATTMRGLAAQSSSPSSFIALPTSHLLSDLSTVSTSDLDLEVNSLSSSVDSTLPSSTIGPSTHTSTLYASPAQGADSLLSEYSLPDSMVYPPRQNSPLKAPGLTAVSLSASARTTALSLIPLALVRPSTVSSVRHQSLALSSTCVSSSVTDGTLSQFSLSEQDSLLPSSNPHVTTVGYVQSPVASDILPVSPIKAAESFSSSEGQATAPLSFSSLSSSQSSDSGLKAKAVASWRHPVAVGDIVQLALADETIVSQNSEKLGSSTFDPPDFLPPSCATSTVQPPASLALSTASHADALSGRVDATSRTPDMLDSPLRGYPPQEQPWSNAMFGLVQSTPVMDTSSSSSSATESFLHAVAPLSPLKHGQVATGYRPDPKSNVSSLASAPSSAASSFASAPSSGVLSLVSAPNEPVKGDLLPPASPVSELLSDSMANSYALAGVVSPLEQDSIAPRSLSKTATAFTVALDNGNSTSEACSGSPSAASLQASFKQRKQQFMRSSARRLDAIKQHSAGRSDTRRAAKRRPSQDTKQTTSSSGCPVLQAGGGMTLELTDDRRVRFASPLQEFFSASFGSSSRERSPVDPGEMRARTKRLVARLEETQRRAAEEQKREEARARQHRVQQLQRKIDANRAKKASSQGPSRLHAHPLPPRELQDKTVSSKPWR